MYKGGWQENIRRKGDVLENLKRVDESRLFREEVG
jgi:hypothetical protein